MKTTKTNLTVDFNIDRLNRTINVVREFSAPVDKVWEAWTTSKILDQWWAPKPWRAVTDKMDFREGGSWLYRMIGPQGEQNWARADFKSITPLQEYICDDAFCDKDGNIDHSFPIANWKIIFSENINATLVNIEITFDDIASVDKYIGMGFQEGFLAAMENLDELLAVNDDRGNDKS